MAPEQPALRFDDSLTSARMVRMLDEGLRAAFWMDAAMAVAIAIDGLQLEPSAHVRARTGVAAVLAACLALEYRGKLVPVGSRALGEDPALPFQLVLWGAAAVSARNEYYENSMWSGWATLALARLGLRAPNWHLVPLAVAHAFAVLVSYRGPAQDRLRVQAEQLVTTAIGPITVQFARWGIGRLDRNERELQARLLEVEDLHDLAEALHSSHPVTGAVTDLEKLLPEEARATREAFRDARKALVTAARALPEGHNAFEFADQFAGTLAARIYPAWVELEIDEDDLCGPQ